MIERELRLNLNLQDGKWAISFTTNKHSIKLNGAFAGIRLLSFAFEDWHDNSSKKIIPTNSAMNFVVQLDICYRPIGCPVLGRSKKTVSAPP